MNNYYDLVSSLFLSSLFELPVFATVTNPIATRYNSHH
jgi:hypothetical protein